MSSWAGGTAAPLPTAESLRAGTIAAIGPGPAGDGFGPDEAPLCVGGVPNPVGSEAFEGWGSAPALT